MSIQSNINQTLSIAGLLFTQNPSIRAAAEKRTKLKELSAKESSIQKQFAALDKEPSASQTGIRQQLAGDLAEVAREQFKTDPTAEGFEKYREAYSETEQGLQDRATTVAEEPEVIAQETFEEEQREQAYNEALDRLRQSANSASGALQAAQEERRMGRVVTDIDTLPTSLGVTVGELSPQARAYIEKEYRKGDN